MLARIGQPVVLIKIMEKRWIDEMYEKGNMRFSCPQKWVDAENKRGMGQGDKYEGVFAIDRSGTGTDREERFRKKYKKNLIVTKEGNSKFYQLHKTLGCPTFCFYSLIDDYVEVVGEVNDEGLCKVKCTIPKQFFTDFANGRTAEEIENLPEQEQPAVLVILGNDNIGKFVNGVRKGLMEKYSLARSNVLVGQVEYNYNRKDDADFLSTKEFHPMELFCKGKEFEHQREARIVVNSKKYNFSKTKQGYLEINIGSMKGYSYARKFLIQDDIELVLDVEVKDKKAVEERDGTLNRGYGNM